MSDVVTSPNPTPIEPPVPAWSSNFVWFAVLTFFITALGLLVALAILRPDETLSTQTIINLMMGVLSPAMIAMVAYLVRNIETKVDSTEKKVDVTHNLVNSKMTELMQQMEAKMHAAVEAAHAQGLNAGIEQQRAFEQVRKKEQAAATALVLEAANKAELEKSTRKD